MVRKIVVEEVSLYMIYNSALREVFVSDCEELTALPATKPAKPLISIYAAPVSDPEVFIAVPVVGEPPAVLNEILAILAIDIVGAVRIVAN